VSSGTVLDAELLLWPRQHLGSWAVFSAAFHYAERAPRVTSSLTAESPTIRSLKMSLVSIQGLSPPVSCAQGRLVNEVHAREVYSHEVYARETHVCEVHAREVHTHEMYACETYACEMHAYEV
jgi:hypothetical protein